MSLNSTMPLFTGQFGLEILSFNCKWKFGICLRDQLDQKEENNQGFGHKDNYPVGRTSNESSGASVSFPKPLVIIDMTLFETIVFYFLFFYAR